MRPPEIGEAVRLIAEAADEFESRAAQLRGLLANQAADEQHPDPEYQIWIMRDRIGFAIEYLGRGQVGDVRGLANAMVRLTERIDRGAPPS